MEEFIPILSSTFQIRASESLLKHLCGVSLYTLSWVWNHVENFFMHLKYAKRNILIALHFLRHYPTEIVGATYWRMQDPKYYSSLVWDTIVLLFMHLPKPNFGERHFQPAPTGMFSDVFTVVDATECVIQPPRKTWSHQAIYYSNKKKIHGLKYQIVCRSLDGRIVDVCGPFPCTVHDKKILDAWQVSHGSQFEKQELMAADKGYIGQALCMVPLKTNQTFTKNDSFYNIILGSVRCIVEQAIGRIKIFRCLQYKWRHDLYKHEYAFVVCTILANRHIQERPIRKTNSKLLYV